jgi:D-alanyl-lipoteichoic acid acyltransferase DltB (MBOAT superfamily)
MFLGVEIAWTMSPLFLVLLLATGILEWWFARRMQRSRNPREISALQWGSVAVNLTLLAVVLAPFSPAGSSTEGKGFLASYIADQLVAMHAHMLPIVYCIISKMTMVLDVEKGKLKEPLRLSHALIFTSLFSRYAGFPVDRARDTVPQLLTSRAWSWSRAEEAFWLVLQGLLKLSLYRVVEPAYMDMMGKDSSGLAIVVGCWFATVGFWLGFAGRVDIVRALALFLGIRITPNFDAPLTSTNIAEFWRRWNISVFAFLSEDVFSRINFSLRRWGNFGIAIACYITFIGSGLIHRVTIGNVADGILMGSTMYVYIVGRKRFRKWTKHIDDPRVMAVASWFVLFNIFAASMLFEVHESMRSMMGAVRSVFAGPLLPSLWTEIDWAMLLPATALAMVVHTLPHHRGGDAWMCSLRGRSRLAHAVGTIGLLVFWNWK